MFPADMVTDLSDVVRIEQAVSAALYERLRSYLPYSIRVVSYSVDCYNTNIHYTH
jgi:GTPase Era involved in 16S rRNA processing